MEKYDDRPGMEERNTDRIKPDTPQWHEALQIALKTAGDLLWYKVEAGHYLHYDQAEDTLKALSRVRQALEIAYALSQLPLPEDKP